MWLASVRFPKPPVPLASGLGCSDDLVGPISSLETCPQPQPSGGGSPKGARALGCRLPPQAAQLPSERLGKEKHPWIFICTSPQPPRLLGLFNWLETMAGTVSPRVKSLSWAWVSFWSRTHFLLTSLSSCPHLGFVTNLA